MRTRRSEILFASAFPLSLLLFPAGSAVDQSGNQSVGPEKEEASFLTATVNQLLGGCGLYVGTFLVLVSCFAAWKIYGCIRDCFRRSHLPKPLALFQSAALVFSRSPASGQSDGESRWWCKMFFPVTIMDLIESEKTISCPLVFCFVLMFLPPTISKVRPFDVLDITADQREAAGQRVQSRWGSWGLRGSGLTKALGLCQRPGAAPAENVTVCLLLLFLHRDYKSVTVGRSRWFMAREVRRSKGVSCTGMLLRRLAGER